jgi:hypothetical protein
MKWAFVLDRGFISTHGSGSALDDECITCPTSTVARLSFIVIGRTQVKI